MEPLSVPMTNRNVSIRLLLTLCIDKNTTDFVNDVIHDWWIIFDHVLPLSKKILAFGSNPCPAGVDSWRTTKAIV